MRRFKNILVTAQPDTEIEPALRMAADIAAANDAKVSVFDVVAPLRSRRVAKANPDLSRYLEGVVTDHRRLELEGAVRTTVGSVADVGVGVGVPFIEIIRRVITHRHDLVITVPDQPAGFLGLSKASTTMHLLRKCPVPVWVHRSEMAHRRDVLTAVGPFPEGAPTPLDRKLTELGASLADRMGGRLHLLHAWQLEGESILRHGRARLAAQDVDGFVAEARMAANEAVEKLLAETGLSSSPLDVRVVKEKPVAAIVGAAAEIRPGVAVMGTVSRAGIAGLLIGNTAERVLAELDCSVLAVKPSGYVSPVSV